MIWLCLCGYFKECVSLSVILGRMERTLHHKANYVNEADAVDITVVEGYQFNFLSSKPLIL
jgi:hypothetical protein